MSCTLTFVAACLALVVAGLSIAAGIIARTQLLAIEAALTEMLALHAYPGAREDDDSFGRHRANDETVVLPESPWSRSQAEHYGGSQ